VNLGSRMLGLALSLLVATSLGLDADGLLVPRLSLDAAVAATPDLHFQRELAAPAAEGAPLRAPVASPPSLLAASAGFLVGDVLTLGIWAAGSAYTASATEEDYLGAGLLTVMSTSVAAVLAPPMLGVLWARRTPPQRGSGRALLAGGALHLAGLIAAASLLDHDERWLAAGVLVAVDLGVAPWVVVRMLRAESGIGDSE
jgi:hypothetical protein